MKCQWIGRAATAVVAGFVIAAAPAQAIVGKDVPALSFTAWPRGAPIVPGGEGAPRVTVFACYTTPQTAPQLAWDAAHLARLQAEFGPQGARVVVVVPAADAVGRLAIGDCSVAVPTGGSAHAWLGDEAGSCWHLLVVDRAATVTFVGELGSGLEDAVANTLAGTNITLDERRAWQLRRMESFDDLPARFLRDALAYQLANAPRDGGWSRACATRCRCTTGTASPRPGCSTGACRRSPRRRAGWRTSRTSCCASMVAPTASLRSSPTGSPRPRPRRPTIPWSGSRCCARCSLRAASASSAGT
ncbi:MAG: hypothetical protein H6838_19750 [Planctomycetes bacterium]|nr:hypothetical protein [Planctomycetota bacterium]